MKLADIIAQNIVSTI